jgi:hypothetical protein
MSGVASVNVPEVMVVELSFVNPLGDEVGHWPAPR